MADYRMDCCSGYTSHTKSCPSQTPEKVAARLEAKRESDRLDDLHDSQRWKFIEAGWVKARKIMVVGLDGDDKPIWASKCQIDGRELARSRELAFYLDLALTPDDPTNPVERLS